jgi:hypothetical protein
VMNVKKQYVLLMVLTQQRNGGGWGSPTIRFIKKQQHSTTILLTSRLDILLLGDTLQFKDPTPLGGMALALHSTADLPYPRNPPYEVRTPHLHGAPPTDDTTQVAHMLRLVHPRSTTSSSSTTRYWC